MAKKRTRHLAGKALRDKRMDRALARATRESKRRKPKYLKLDALQMRIVRERAAQTPITASSILGGLLPFLRLKFEIEGTGGGNSALVLKLPDRSRLFVTDEDGSIPAADSKEFRIWQAEPGDPPDGGGYNVVDDIYGVLAFVSCFTRMQEGMDEFSYWAAKLALGLPVKFADGS